jgi:hypothetical protein
VYSDRQQTLVAADGGGKRLEDGKRVEDEVE